MAEFSESLPHSPEATWQPASLGRLVAENSAGNETPPASASTAESAPSAETSARGGLVSASRSNGQALLTKLSGMLRAPFALFSQIRPKRKKEGAATAPEKARTAGEGEKKNGNAFTKIFARNDQTSESEEALIENIIAQSQHKEGEERDMLGLKNQAQNQEILSAQAQKNQKAAEILQLAKIVLGSSLLIPLTSFLLNGLFISGNGFMARILPDRNYGVILERKALDLARAQEDIVEKKRESGEYLQKIADIRDNKVLSSLIAERIRWKDVFETINAITDRSFEGNKVSHYVTYTNYSGKSASGMLSVQGQVRDVEGKSWAALIKLKNALNAHDDFEGVTINQFVKQRSNTDSRISSSEYISPFTFQFEYVKAGPAVAANSVPPPQ